MRWPAVVAVLAIIVSFGLLAYVVLVGILEGIPRTF
jgi:hypothetical protein